MPSRVPSRVHATQGRSDATLHALPNVKVILVAPKNPQNIGSVRAERGNVRRSGRHRRSRRSRRLTWLAPSFSAQVLRASGNFGVNEVRVVNPRCDVLNEDIIATVACESPTLLRVEASLQDALADSTVSLAFSRRKGKGRPVLPSLAAFFEDQRAEQHTEGALHLVFGREESGLAADEVLMCSHTVEIPSTPSFPSLNLSHAVAVILSQVYEREDRRRGSMEGRGGMSDPRHALATHSEMNALYDRILGLLERQGIDTAESRQGGDAGNHGRRVLAPAALKSILLKSQASAAEVRSIFGLLKDLEASL